MTVDVARLALDRALNGIATIPTKSGVKQIAWPNVDYKPEIGQPWVRVTFRPFENEAAALGPDAQSRMDGLYLVDLFYPANTGPQAADTMAKEIIAAFKHGTILTEGGFKVHILRSKSEANVSEPQWFQIPVTIQWYAYY